MEAQIKNLFNHYLKGFKDYSLECVQQCYTLPCTLHTPDKLAYIENQEKFEKEFIDIFAILKQANTKDILATRASYAKSGGNGWDICIDWAFISESGDVFTDFCAFYHVIETEGKLGIVSVVSHSIEQSVSLANMLVIEE